ncbi:MAG TPA: HAD hydrolase-like protein [Candidatus Hydrogenedentes bacterium]|nr:HAD hydrolase-like protein [Candidatus Hydrogenedentota bacterium]HOL75432.1 HAD hydrolase-like protein [Candidatus Hydrogenedentota bacterium]HPO84941.1 HAD hydrolase-like protein [Candidatus Hydrogenedentota bacterium]
MIRTQPEVLIWDWNGTLLDDVNLCVRAVNALCQKRNLPEIGLKEYQEKFTFPVIDYYRAVGFDFVKEPFEIPALEWITFYSNRVKHEAFLYPDALNVLRWAKENGLKQIILSAHQKEMLLVLLEHFGITPFFDSIWALETYEAKGKTHLAHEMFNHYEFTPDSVVLIGDTLHDHEVAQELQIPCLLVAQGHQSRERLLQARVPVLDSLKDVPPYIDAWSRDRKTPRIVDK